ncbi:MAG: TetR/AcrR family transcriptional regulator, partial [Sciscionella sp.]
DLNAYSGEDAVRAARARWRTGQLVEAAIRLLQKAGFENMSIQQLADEASVSVGMIYRYFQSKEDILVAIIEDVLSAFQDTVPSAIAQAPHDPVEQLAAGFRAYCEVIDKRHHAALLTYQESRTLSETALHKIETREIATTRQLERVIQDGIDAGVMTAVDPTLVVYNMVLLAHAWALKHWYFSRQRDLDRYVTEQTAFVLRSLVSPQQQHQYAHLLGC